MNKLPKIISKRQKRVGRGYGTGKGGHTSGRGQKGQKARGKLNILFEGYKVKKSLIKRLPLQRGRGKFKGRHGPVVVNLTLLNLIPSGSEVNPATLIKLGIVGERDAKIYGIKILGDGEIEKKLIIKIPISHSAAKKIEKAGGKIQI